MKTTTIRASSLALGAAMLASTLTGCAPPTAAECSLGYSQAASGTMIGAGIGATAGALAGIAGRARGGQTLLLAAGGAVVGGLIGNAIGAERDRACHQMALQRALEEAELQRQEWVRRHPAYAHRVSRPVSPDASPAQQRAAAGPQPYYKTVAWANKASNTGGTITPTAAIASGDSGEVCMVYQDSVSKEGQTQSAPGKACRGADGEWHPAT